MLPEGGATQRSSVECTQEASGEYSKHRECWGSGKKRGLWVVRLPNGGGQEVPYVAGEKLGHWVLRYADGTVEEGAVVERKAREAEAQRARSHAPGTKFRDCPECPEMVAVPEGSFMMGSTSGDDDERPVHEVTIARPFAVGVYEVTWEEWDVCVSDGECGGYRQRSTVGGRGVHPVINVGWEDAQGYVRWLSRKTGEAYRLLSESEWEYVARAGTTGPYHFGSSLSSSQANYGGDRRETVPVGSYPANAFGLHDVHGNVWEWVEDCWNDSYNGAPSNGSAWESGDCSRRVLRGGSWFSSPGALVSTTRIGSTTDDRNGYFGFRVARTLTP